MIIFSLILITMGRYWFKCWIFVD